MPLQPKWPTDSVSHYTICSSCGQPFLPQTITQYWPNNIVAELGSNICAKLSLSGPSDITQYIQNLNVYTQCNEGLLVGSVWNTTSNCVEVQMPCLCNQNGLRIAWVTTICSLCGQCFLVLQLLWQRGSALMHTHYHKLESAWLHCHTACCLSGACPLKSSDLHEACRWSS